MTWLKHDFWTRTGGWEFDHSHGADTSSPSHWQQVEEQAPKPVGWMVCFLLLTFVPVQKLCVNIYIYIYALLYEFCFLWFTNCVLLSDDNSLMPGCLWLLAFVLNNTLILGIWCSTIPHLPGCFCPWTFFQNIGFNMVPSDPFMSHLATQLSGFATDCPCDVWCRGLTTCVLHVGPPFGNRFLNTSWAVGLTYWIAYLHFFCILTCAIIYVLIHHVVIWLYLYFLNILYFSSTPVLTSSIDVVFVFSITYGGLPFLGADCPVTEYWQYLLNMKCLTNGLLFLQLPTSLGCFCPRTFSWKMKIKLD